MGKKVLFESARGHNDASGVSFRSRNHITSFMFHNFADCWAMKDLWRVFKRYGDVKDIYLARKRLSNGQRFGFVRFGDLSDIDGFVKILNSIHYNGRCIRAYIAHERRPMSSKIINADSRWFPVQRDSKNKELSSGVHRDYNPTNMSHENAKVIELKIEGKAFEFKIPLSEIDHKFEFSFYLGSYNWKLIKEEGQAPSSVCNKLDSLDDGCVLDENPNDADIHKVSVVTSDVKSGNHHISSDGSETCVKVGSTNVTKDSDVDCIGCSSKNVDRCRSFQDIFHIGSLFAGEDEGGRIPIVDTCIGKDENIENCSAASVIVESVSGDLDEVTQTADPILEKKSISNEGVNTRMDDEMGSFNCSGPDVKSLDLGPLVPDQVTKPLNSNVADGLVLCDYKEVDENVINGPNLKGCFDPSFSFSSIENGLSDDYLLPSSRLKRKHKLKDKHHFFNYIKRKNLMKRKRHREEIDWYCRAMLVDHMEEEVVDDAEISSWDSISDS